MAFSLLTLNEFTSLFSGNNNAHGVHEPTNTVEENGKKAGRSYTKKECVEEEHYMAHLEGKIGLGIIPIKENNLCSFSVIDVDIYDKNLTRLVQKIYSNGIPVFPFRSKSGGLHLYTFYEQPVKAKDCISWMTSIRIALSLGNTTEIFPKQSILNAEGIGSWINLPYFNEEKTERYLIGPNGEKTALDEATYVCRNGAQTKESMISIIDALPLSDAPPCLQAIYLERDTQYRNQYLFSMACYFKTKHGDDFENKVVEANAKLDRPFSLDELQKSVISSNRKKDYSYKCSEEPICSICDKEECSRRKYGIGGDLVSELSFEEFTQVTADPPYYVWKINGKKLTFYHESDIIQQHEFRNLCFRELGILPYPLDQKSWTKIINRALSNRSFESVSPEEDISSGSLFTEYVVEYLTGRTMATNKEQILVGRVFSDVGIQGYVFKPKEFLLFLLQQKQFKSFGLSEIQDRLRIFGAMPKRYYINKSATNERVWYMPYSGIDRFVHGDPSEINVEFNEEKKNEPF